MYPLEHYTKGPAQKMRKKMRKMRKNANRIFPPPLSGGQTPITVAGWHLLKENEQVVEQQLRMIRCSKLEHSMKAVGVVKHMTSFVIVWGFYTVLYKSSFEQLATAKRSAHSTKLGVAHAP